MAFKLRQPIKIDPVARYEVPFTPDNIPDGSGLVARANDNGNMIVNKNIPRNSKLRKIAESHEDNHLRAMMDGKLAYDDKAVYHTMDGKGMKRTPRSEFDESNKNLPWEAPAYKAGEAMAQIDMKPKKNKLDRAGKVEAGNFAFAFREIGKPMRSQDDETVSMSENFGSAMVKKFGKGLSFKTKEGDDPKVKKDTDVSGNATSQAQLNAEAKAKAENILAQADYKSEDLGEGKTRFFKEADAEVTKVIPGKKVTKKAESSGSWLDSFKNEKDNALYEKYKGTEGGPDGEPGTKEYADWKSTFAGFGDQTITGKAKVKDEYIKQDEVTDDGGDDGKDDGEDNGGDDSSTFTFTTTEKKGKNKIFDGSGKRKIQGKIRDFKYKCKKGFLRKGGKCQRKTEGKRGKIAKFKKKR